MYGLSLDALLFYCVLCLMFAAGHICGRLR